MPIWVFDWLGFQKLLKAVPAKHTWEPGKAK